MIAGDFCGVVAARVCRESRDGCHWQAEVVVVVLCVLKSRQNS